MQGKQQWLSAYQDQFCAWVSLAPLPTDTAQVFFLSNFLKKKKGFFFLLPASRIC